MNGMHYIDGAWVPGSAVAQVLEKATGAEIGTYALGTAADVDKAVAAAKRAQPEWAALLGAERAAVLSRAARIMERRAGEFVETLMRETGGVRGKARGEVAAAVGKFDDSAALARRAGGDLLPAFKPGKLILNQRIPLGVVAAIIPWNFPIVLALRPIGPALALGNTLVLKPAELTPIAGGQMLAEVLEEAGAPPGVFNVVTGEGPDAGEPLAAHPDVAMIHFTGSTEIGRLMAQIAARDFRRTALELGGDNAFLILDDASLEEAAACGAWAAYEFQGQTCITAGRHLVMESVADDYTALMVDRARALKVGDPFDDGVSLGPIISETQLRRVDDLVSRSVKMGARIVEGGTHEGLFYRPTVVTGVTPDMPLFTEETFGPVVPITAVSSEDEAVSLVNAFPALVNSIYTGDLMRGLALAERITSGMVHVNDAMGRPTGEEDIDEFTRRRWIGLQREPLTWEISR
ncbi:aldehyde dehydrogenase family protein [Streptosporangiaceae bacterium NEAU-GS5]|nr:aldehyde dehydrogenase family protein [Streptosporangiaceae bacterium NEAU-GS5]